MLRYGSVQVCKAQSRTCMLRITHCKHSKVIRVETSLKTEKAQTLKMKLNLPMREIKKIDDFRKKSLGQIVSYTIKLHLQYYLIILSKRHKYIHKKTDTRIFFGFIYNSQKLKTIQMSPNKATDERGIFIQLASCKTSQ